MKEIHPIRGLIVFSIVALTAILLLPTLAFAQATERTECLFGILDADGANAWPRANAGQDYIYFDGQSSMLDGTASSDTDGDFLTYSWRQISTSSMESILTVTGTDSPILNFTLPQLEQDVNFTFQLIVKDPTSISDGEVHGSSCDEAIIQGKARNDLPVPFFDTPGSATENMAITLDGLRSYDVEDVEVSYLWTITQFVAGARVTLPIDNPTDARIIYTIPNFVANTAIFITLLVTEEEQFGTLPATSDELQRILSITANNDPPTTNAGSDQTILEGATVTLTSSGSDPENVTLIYDWMQVGSTPPDVTVTLVSADDSADATRTFIAPNLLECTELTFNLISNDGVQDSVADSVIITVIPLANCLSTSGAGEAQVEAIGFAVARAIMGSTASVVASRINNIARGVAVNVGSLNLDNYNNASAVQIYAQAFATNSHAIKTLLGNSNLSMSLNAHGGDAGSESINIWVRGEYNDLAGKSKAIDWDGNLSGFHLGIDSKIHTDAGNKILIGAAVSALNSDVDYTDKTTTMDIGNYEIDMDTITPYIGWRADGFDLWASVGLGHGAIEHTPDVGDKTDNDVTQISYAIGGGADLVPAGDALLRITGQAMQSKFDIDGDDKQTINVNRARIAMELSVLNNLQNGSVVERSMELGARYDGGDGQTGKGIELGGNLKYYSGNGFTVEGSARVLFAHNGGYEEWGIYGTVRKESEQDGQGVSFHLTPAYGDANSSFSQLITQELNDNADNTADSDYQMNLTSRLGYGISMCNINGIFTPYAELVLSRINQYRMGINWKPNQTFNLTLLSEQANEYRVRLQGTINF